MRDLSPEALSRLSPSERNLYLAFGCLSPQITDFPHCIFPAGGGSLRVITNVVQESVGIWGDRPFINAQGEPYLEPEDGRIIEDFRLWSLPKNQAYALQEGAMGKLGTFTMLLSSETPLHVLRMTYDSLDHTASDYYYYDCIAMLSQWIEQLRWAYVPLEYEQTYAMFVAGKSHRDWVTDVMQQLSTAKVEPVFAVSRDGSRYIWNGPLSVGKG